MSDLFRRSAFLNMSIFNWKAKKYCKDKMHTITCPDPNLPLQTLQKSETMLLAFAVHSWAWLPRSHSILYKVLPKLSSCEADKLKQELSLAEVTAITEGLITRKVPCLDKLPIKFYRVSYPTPQTTLVNFPGGSWKWDPIGQLPASSLHDIVKEKVSQWQ